MVKRASPTVGVARTICDGLTATTSTTAGLCDAHVHAVDVAAASDDYAAAASDDS